MSVEAHDSREQRCRLLGHPVPFSYCRQLPEGHPCRLVLNCWHEQFDVAAFIQEHCTAEQIRAIQAPPKPKLASLVELIERARQGGEPEDGTCG